MIYIILSGLLTISLIPFSYYVDNGRKNLGLIVNSILLLFCYSLAEVLTLVMINYFSNYTLTFVLAQVREILENFFILNLCFNIMIFPSLKKHILMVIAELLFVALFIVLVFHTSTGVTNSPESGLVLNTEYLSSQISYRWQQLWKFLFHYLLPGVAALYIIVKPESTNNRLARERLFLNLVSLGVIAGSYSLFTYAATVMPFFSSFKPYGYLLALLVTYSASKSYIIYDVKSLLLKSLQFIWLYIFPALVLGGITAFVLPYRQSNIFLFVVVLICLMIAVLTRSHALPKIFSQRHMSFAIGYEKILEEKFASLDYNLSMENFGNQVDKILEEVVKSTGINILISNGNEFVSVYSSYHSFATLPLDFPAFEHMINEGRQVVFQNQLESHHELEIAKNELSQLFEQGNSQGCIILAEGYKIFGVVLLSEKKMGNDYNNYDYSVFTKLYPYFFMVGYYMNSVANEGVIGTINREVKMSDQIIQSIQENLDHIDNPKVDISYLMKPARNMGGEFIDFIRLTDTRHIMILGSMSGRGITASMTMVIMKSIIRTFLVDIHDFKELVQRVNHFIRFNLPKGTFFAGFFGLLDLSDNTLYYINCGVPTLMLYTLAYNNVIEIQGDGKILGFVPDINKYVKVKKIKLNPGDVLFTCTSGLIESESIRGEAFGKARIQQSILDNLGASSDKIIQFTCDNLKAFTSKEQESDLTCSVMKFFS